MPPCASRAAFLLTLPEAHGESTELPSISAIVVQNGNAYDEGLDRQQSAALPGLASIFREHQPPMLIV